MTTELSFWRTCIRQVISKWSKSFEPSEDEMQGISSTYETAGGKWESLAKGDPDSWALLRQACKAYLKKTRRDDDQ